MRERDLGRGIRDLGLGIWGKVCYGITVTGQDPVMNISLTITSTGITDMGTRFFNTNTGFINSGTCINDLRTCFFVRGTNFINSGTHARNPGTHFFNARTQILTHFSNTGTHIIDKGTCIREIPKDIIIRY